MKKIETIFEKVDEKDLVEAECAHQPRIKQKRRENHG